MSRLKAFYAVPGWARLLTGGAALVVSVSLPMLVTSASNIQVFLVAVAGTFAASITLFGRPPHPGRA